MSFVGKADSITYGRAALNYAENKELEDKHVAHELSRQFARNSPRNGAMARSKPPRQHQKGVLLAFIQHIGGNYSEKDFSEICNVSKSKSPKYEEKKI